MTGRQLLIVLTIAIYTMSWFIAGLSFGYWRRK